MSPPRPPAGEGPKLRAESARLPKGVTYTSRVTFEVNGVIANTAVVRVRIAAKGCMTGLRFNGRSLACPKFDDRATQSTGCFVARRDLVHWVNTVEIDVNEGVPSSNEEPRVWLGITATGIWPPQEAATGGASVAMAATRSHGGHTGALGGRNRGRQECVPHHENEHHKN